MSEIKRYNPAIDIHYVRGVVEKTAAVMHESTQGEWVRWEDVQKSLEFLEAEGKELIEELRLMQDQINRLVDE
jgi:hypothetical protein